MSDAPGRVLITGAAGFAGSHLLEQVARTGADVVAWRRPEGRRLSPELGGRASWVEVDLLAPAAVLEALAAAAPDVVYHCAGAAHVGSSWMSTRETLAANVIGTHTLLEAVRTVRPSARVVVPGSATIYQTQDTPLDESAPVAPASPYAVSKLAQEMLALGAVREDGLSVVVARAFNHLGPRQDPSFVGASVARQIARIEAGLAEPRLLVGNLSARRDMTDVRDTVRAYLALAARGTPGAVYNVCSGRTVAIEDIVRGLIARASCPVTVELDPARLRRHDAPMLVGSYARLEADTGWAPRIGLDQTLDDLLQYWRDETARHPQAAR